MTPLGFPHSDTSGSSLVWQLTGLFRGLHRLSSPACSKASTSCPESLIIRLQIISLDFSEQNTQALFMRSVRLSLEIVLLFAYSQISEEFYRRFFFAPPDACTPDRFQKNDCASSLRLNHFSPGSGLSLQSYIFAS